MKTLNQSLALVPAAVSSNIDLKAELIWRFPALNDYFFFKVFENAIEVEFNPDWANSTGYYDYAVRAAVPADHNERNIYYCYDDKRRLMVICPIEGMEENVVFFDRYTQDDISVAPAERETRPVGPMTFNAPNCFNGVLSSQLKYNQVANLLNGEFNAIIRAALFMVNKRAEKEEA